MPSSTRSSAARVAKEFKIFYNKNAGKTPTSYTMDHSAGVFIFDPQGRVRLFGSQGYSVDQYLHDIRLLLATG